MTKEVPKNTAGAWFHASEATGDFMGIRYGQIKKDTEEVEWHFVPHSECDGIGGFARLLRAQGASIPELPRNRYPDRRILAPIWRLWRKSRLSEACADRRDWCLAYTPQEGPSPKVAWHLFSEEATRALIERCRKDKLTVNNVLLKGLDQAVRPDIQRPDALIPWMIPVNLRGDLSFADDTENHVSCIDTTVAADDTAADIQSNLLYRLRRGEHRANYLMLSLGKWMSHRQKVAFIESSRRKPAGNIGAFSNLGAWDPNKEISTNDSWLFCPPVVKGQLLSAGCVSFQGRLGLTIQAHPNLENGEAKVRTWMQRWHQGL